MAGFWWDIHVSLEVEMSVFKEESGKIEEILFADFQWLSGPRGQTGRRIGCDG